MKKIAIILLTVMITSCTSVSSVVGIEGYSIDPFNNSQYCVSWE